MNVRRASALMTNGIADSSPSAAHETVAGNCRRLAVVEVVIAICRMPGIERAVERQHGRTCRTRQRQQQD